jgi:hypothetical protein
MREIPHYNTWLPCLHVNRENGTALVKSFRTGRSFPVTLNKEIKYLVSCGDKLHVIKSHVSKEWLAIDYMAGTAIASGDEE